VAFFALHYFLLFVASAMVYPYFQVLLRALGFSDSEVGYLQGLMALAGVCGPMVIGHLADRFRARRGFLVGCWVALVLLLVPLGQTHAFWPAAALVAGIGFAVRAPTPLTDAVVAGSLDDPVHQYGQVRGIGSSGFVLALLVARLFRLVDEHSSASMLGAMLISIAFCAVSSLFLRDRTSTAVPAQPHRRRRASHFDRAFWLFIAATATHQLAMSAYYSFFTLYLSDAVKMENGAWVWALGTAAEIPMLYWAGRVIRRFGLSAMLIASMAAVSVRLAIYALAPFVAVVLAAQVLHALTFGCFHAACIEFLRRKVPAQSRALAMTLYMSLAIALPSWIGSSLGGVVIERWGYGALFFSYALVPAVGIAMLLAGGRRAVDSAESVP
jgi:PPP family 3-phenylpropionic acid transporter